MGVQDLSRYALLPLCVVRSPCRFDIMSSKPTQEEILLKLSPPPFNQSKAVPKDAVHEMQPKWNRSESPGAETRNPVPEHNTALSQTAGVLGHGSRTGPGKFLTQNQTGSGTAAHFQDEPENAPATVPGYGGHIAGKNAGNTFGGTYETANQHAKEHLSTTSQITKYGPGATQQH